MAQGTSLGKDLVLIIGSLGMLHPKWISILLLALSWSNAPQQKLAVVSLHRAATADDRRGGTMIM